MPRSSPAKSMDSGFRRNDRLLDFILSAPNSFHLIYLKELPDMPLNQLHHIILPLRLPVAEIDPGRDRQTKLRRHDLRVRVYEPPLTNEKRTSPVK